MLNKNNNLLIMDLVGACESAVGLTGRCCGLRGGLLGAFKSSCLGRGASVWSGEWEESLFPVRVALGLGCIVSPCLFGLYLDGVVREVNESVFG